MAITKRTENDKNEVVNKWNIQVRTATVIEEDGGELTRSYHRHVLVPFSSNWKTDDDGKDVLTDGKRTYTHTATDISGEDADVQAIANAAWTDSVKDDCKAAFEAANPAE